MAEAGIQTTMLTRDHRSGEITVPVITVQGAASGPVLAVTAGVHGAEYAGIDAAVRLVDEIDPEDLSGTLKIVPVANVPGFLARREVVCPIDDLNLNRIFPGDPDGSYSESMADLIFSGVVKDADAHIDMHGGDIYEALVPYIGLTRVADEQLNKRVLEMGRAFALDYILEFKSLPGTSNKGMSICAAARQAGIPSILAEVGGEGVLIESDALRHVQGVKNVMNLLGMIDEAPRTPGPAREMYTDFWKINHNGLVYPTAELGAHIHAGDRIGLVTDWYGNTLEEVIAPSEAWIIAIVTTLAARKDAIIYQVAVTGD